jgi:hypothetical protein
LAVSRDSVTAAALSEEVFWVEDSPVLVAAAAAASWAACRAWVAAAVEAEASSGALSRDSGAAAVGVEVVAEAYLVSE